MGKTSTLIILFFSIHFWGQVEQTNRDHKKLEQMNIGWAPIMAPNGNVVGKNTMVQGRTYTAYQIELIDIFTEWIKKSYTPIGGLAQPSRNTIPDCKSNCLYVPFGTGISMKMWAPAYDNAGKKIIRAQPASHDDIHIYSNWLPGREDADGWFNTQSQYFFSMYYTPKLVLLNPEHAKIIQPKVDEIKKNIELDGNFFVYFTDGGNQVNIVLSPLDKLPIKPLTKGTLLNEGIKAIERAKSANKLMDWQYERYKNNIEKLREKHQASLNEPAQIRNGQLTVISYTTDPDIFDVSGLDYGFPIYQFDESIYVQAKKDQPLWITISFPYTTPSKIDYSTYTVRSEIFNAMLYNFNYQFVYDYFFNPGKVKGKIYEMRNKDIFEKNVEKYSKVD